MTICKHCGTPYRESHLCIARVLADPVRRELLKELVREVLAEEKVIHLEDVAGGKFHRVFREGETKTVDKT